jgi:hypothetical protein
VVDFSDAIFALSDEFRYFVTVVFVEGCGDSYVGEEFVLASSNSDLGVSENSVEVIVS